MRQLLQSPAKRPLALADLEELPYYDTSALIKLITVKAEGLRNDAYLDWPAIVHMETIAICNAACGFCPYPGLERKGVKMSDALIEKIINDLADIPRGVPFQLAPYKVSDPFLEVRLFDILELVNSRLPNADISIITNGSPLTEKKIEQLRRIRNIKYLSVSLNCDNEEEYEAVMKIPFSRTIERLRILHRKKAGGEVGFPVRLTRVSENRLSDSEFVAWAKSNFPEFMVAILPRNDWIGEIPSGQGIDQVPDAPCHRWFDLSITATGKVAMCCMDGQAQYPKGDVNTQHALDIYNQPRLRELRQSLISRRHAADPCNRCTYLSY